MYSQPVRRSTRTPHIRLLRLTPRTSEYEFDAKALDFARRYPMPEPPRFTPNRITPRWRPGRREHALTDPIRARAYFFEHLHQMIEHMRHVTSILPDVCTEAAATGDRELWAHAFAVRLLTEDALAVARSADALGKERAR